MDIAQRALEAHRQWKGKLEVVPRAPLQTTDDLALAYTPGVAAPCLEIEKHPELSFTLTRRGNLVAVVTDGTAVLGLGDIGPEAGMPVMEGKCCLFKAFADVDAVPLCIKSHDVEEIVRTVYLLSGSFGGINLEDIAAPRCFEIERRLKAICDIPIFHDDQHGTAVVTAAALLNALKLCGKTLQTAQIVINGAGAAGAAIAWLLLAMGAENLMLVDRSGIICEGGANLNDEKQALAKVTNREKRVGGLKEAMVSADVFLGVSAPGVLSKDMVSTMAEKACVFAMANPIPEIFPQEALEAGAYIAATGRSDFPNQINNVLAFPGIFRGVLDARHREITQPMLIAAATAIASLVDPEKLCTTYIIPAALDKRVAPAVAKAVMEAIQ